MEPASGIDQERPAPHFAEKTCPGCGRVFRPNNGRQIYHSPKCRRGHADREALGKEGVRHRMASGAELIGDSEGAKERHASGRETAKTEREREKEALKGLKKLAAEAVGRASDHGVVGEQQMLQRIKALGAAKRAEDWAATEHALIDLAACALSWAARIGHAEGEERLPVPASLTADTAATEQIKGIEEPLNGQSKSVAERYADVLLAAAELNLDGFEARATIERLLGVGL